MVFPNTTPMSSLKKNYFYTNELCQHTKNYKAAANFINGSVKSYLNENAIEMSQFSISTKRLAQLIQLVDDGKDW